MAVSGDTIAEVVLQQFDSLPKKRKPQLRADGLQEWVPLSGIVAQGQNGLKCISLGYDFPSADVDVPQVEGMSSQETRTGMKCLPAQKIPQANGIILHDWHAEVVAIRSFNSFLLEECHRLALSDKQSSEYIHRRRASSITDANFQPFALNDDISLHMYCSETPCGDASMELTMAAQDDDTPWETPSPNAIGTISTTPSSNITPAPSLLGRGHFSNLGIVRRKPSRPDAPPTLSKSCSDKISLLQCTSLLSSTASLLLSPSAIYLKTLTLPQSQCVPHACIRAFGSSGRLAPLASRRWRGGYQHHSFEVLTTRREFAFSRRLEEHKAQEGYGSSGQGMKEPPKEPKTLVLVPSNLAAAWTPYGEQTLIGGVLQGRKQADPRGASMICRKSMWKLVREVATILSGTVVMEGETPESWTTLQKALRASSYGVFKDGSWFDARKTVKLEVRRDALVGWVCNTVDDFGLD